MTPYLIFVLLVGLAVYGVILYYMTRNSGVLCSLTDDELVIKDNAGSLIYSVRYSDISDVRMVNKTPINNILLRIEYHRCSPWDYATRTFGKAILVAAKMTDSKDPLVCSMSIRRALITPDNPDVFLCELEGRMKNKDLKE